MGSFDGCQMMIVGLKHINASRDGHVSGIELAVAPRLSWTYAAQHNQQSAPIIAGEHVYFGGRDAVLRSLSLSNGQEVWSTPIGRTSGSPCVTDELVVIGCDDRKLYAVSRETGQSAWTFEAGLLIASSPAVVDDTVYFTGSASRMGGATGAVFAIDLKTGDLRWKFDTEVGCIASPAIEGDRLICISAGLNGEGSSMYALSRSTGTPLWKKELSAASVFGAPAISQGRIVFDSGKSTLEAYDLQSGELCWEFGMARSRADSSPAIAQGIVFVAGGDGHLYAVDLATGSVKWTVAKMGNTEWNSYASPIVLGSTVIAACWDGHLYGYDTTVGKELWNVPFGKEMLFGVPHYANGHITVAAVQEQKVYCLSVG